MAHAGMPAAVYTRAGRRCATSSAADPLPHAPTENHLRVSTPFVDATARPPDDQTTEPRALSSSAGRPSIARSATARRLSIRRPLFSTARLVGGRRLPTGRLASASRSSDPTARAAACAKANDVARTTCAQMGINIIYPTRSSYIFLPAQAQPGHMHAEVLACRVNGEVQVKPWTRLPRL
jgi:hypothetical protein